MRINYSEAKDVCPLRGKGVMLKRYLDDDAICYSGVFHNGRHIFSVKTKEEPTIFEMWDKDFKSFATCYGIEE